MSKWIATLLLLYASAKAHGQVFSFTESRPATDGMYAALMAGSDTLYCSVFPQGMEVIRYKAKFSGAYVILDRSGHIKMRCYLEKGRLLGYYQIYDGQGVLREDGYYVHGAKVQSRRLP